MVSEFDFKILWNLFLNDKKNCSSWYTWVGVYMSKLLTSNLFSIESKGQKMMKNECIKII